MIGPLWGEKDEAKRIAGWKAVDKYIAEKGYVIPLVQYFAADRLQGVAEGHPERDRRVAADAVSAKPDIWERGSWSCETRAPLSANVSVDAA